MNEVNTMLVKQFLFRVRQKGYSLVENPPRSFDGINIDIYRGKTKICTFDDRQLGSDWPLQVRTDDSTRDDIKGDYHNLFYTFIHLRDLYMFYDAAEPLRGYDHSLGFRAIQQYDNWTLAVKSYSNTGHDKSTKGYPKQNCRRANFFMTKGLREILKPKFLITFDTYV